MAIDRANKKNTCIDCGTDIPWNHKATTQFLRCPPCRKSRKRQTNRYFGAKRRGTLEDKEVFQPYKRQPKPKPLMTDAEQRRIDLDCHIRDVKRCGMEYDPGRLLTQREISDLEQRGEVTPIAKIQTDHRLFLDSWIF